MNNYYLDQVTKKPVKIGSKAYIKSLKTKISDNYETKTIMNNISYESYLKIKDNLPKIDNNQFYCYEEKKPAKESNLTRGSHTLRRLQINKTSVIGIL